MPLHPNCQQVLSALSQRGLACEIKEFPESTKTAAEAANVLNVTISEIAKSIVFDCQGELVVVIASGSNRVSEKKLEALLGAKPKRADAEFVKGKTGYPIGGVPPVGHTSAPKIYIDQDLLKFNTVWAAAGTPCSVFCIATEDLIRVSGGIVCEIRE